MIQLITRREVPYAIEKEDEFCITTRSMWGFKSFDDYGWEYVIRSYGVDICKVRVDEVKENGLVIGWKKSLWVTPERYSVTTSTHTNLVRRGYGLPKNWSGTMSHYEPLVRIKK